MNLYERIEKRKSVRKYKEVLLDSTIKEEIDKHIQSCKNIYEGQNLMLKVVDNIDETKQQAGLGFAGGLFKINAPHFLVAISEEREGFLENAGFVQEQLVLKLTDIGIATCWLGTYNEEYLRQLLGLKENQIIINIIALGYEYPGKSIAGSIRNIAGANKRKSISEFAHYKEFGNSVKSLIDSNKTLESICIASSLYPSANNSQPVYIILEEKGGIVFIKSRNGDHKDRKRLDAGIFIAHLYLACVEEGYHITFSNESLNKANYKAPDGFHHIISFKIDKEWM